MNPQDKRTLTGCAWFLVVILAAVGLGVLSYYLDCSYLKYVSYILAGAGGGIIGDRYLSGRKAKEATPWWKYALAVAGMLAFAGLLTWIFDS